MVRFSLGRTRSYVCAHCFYSYASEYSDNKPSRAPSCAFYRDGAYSAGSMTAEETVKKARAPRAKPVKTDDASAAPSHRAKKADATHRLRIRVRAGEHGVLDGAVKQIIDVAARHNATVVGPVPLPIDIK